MFDQAGAGNDDFGPTGVPQPRTGGTNDGSRLADDVVFIPSERVADVGAEASVELRHTEDGQVALLAYSSLEELVAGCGHQQPWIAVPVERVEELREFCDAEVVLWNVVLEPGLRHGSEEGGDTGAR